jgi:hypothetical protein
VRETVMLTDFVPILSLDDLVGRTVASVEVVRDFFLFVRFTDGSEVCITPTNMHDLAVDAGETHVY